LCKAVSGDGRDADPRGEAASWHNLHASVDDVWSGACASSMGDSGIQPTQSV